MNNFSNRINKIKAKTHDFITHSDFALLRDYYRALLNDRNATPEQYEKQCARINEIDRLNAIEPSGQLTQEVDGIFKSDPNVITAYMYQYTLKECRNFPNGDWVSKKISGKILNRIETAKKYFSEKRSN